MAAAQTQDTQRPASSSDSEASAEIERLRRENALLVALLESASELVDVLSPDGRLLRTFRSRGRLLGYESSEIEGHDAFELVHPEDAPMVRAAYERLLQEPSVPAHMQLRIKGRDGTWVAMECTAENRVDDPVVRGIVVCSRDVRARIELERKLRLAQRMESVGRVASGIVHDFNNLLAVVLLGVSKLRAAAAAAPRKGELQFLDEIARAAERGSSLTKRLLSFVRDRPVQPRAVDFGALVAAQQVTLASLLPDDVRLVISSARVPLPVVADPAELEHVLLNLVLNARDALPSGGTVQVETRREQSPERAVLEVRDDGHGMDEATRQRLFEPFFTTKSAEHGTGLGLWTARDVVSRYGGEIDLLSAPEEGSTFRVRLPIASEPARAPSDSGAAPSSSERSKLCILLVDDETRLLEWLGGALEDEGHTVHLASDGAEALEVVRRLALQPDLLISDVWMPRLGGPQLAERLRQRWPELPVLLVSGHRAAAAEARDGDRTMLLYKPFTSQELVAAIDALTATCARTSQDR
jgi:two-component system, cell cycle sensor histidine kinase and response regulator CckA